MWAFRLRRAAALLVAVVMFLPGVASAGHRTIREDPNDTDSVLDIRRVVTDIDREVSYFGIVGWEKFDPYILDTHTTGTSFEFRLDTRGGKAIDGEVTLAAGHDGPGCSVWNWRRGDYVGTYPAEAELGRISCEVPREALGLIEKEIRFQARAVSLFIRRNALDKAPDEGKYRGL